MSLSPRPHMFSTTSPPLPTSRALEPSHALARVGEIAREVGKGGDVVLNMCGRGDKDIFAVAKHLGVEL